MERCQDAIESYDRTIDLDLARPKIWNNKGAMLGNLGGVMKPWTALIVPSGSNLNMQKPGTTKEKL